ncbi:MAG: radical SAM protein [Candidatus Zixiibacteriota bacterium]
MTGLACKINPIYYTAVQKGPNEIIEIGQSLLGHLNNCELCPQECGVDRTISSDGQCGVSDKVRVASCNLHYGEEPPISGSKGSGTIFLSGCSLCCLYCQNYPISQQLVGSEMEIEELADKIISLQDRGAHNINFVTPDHFFGHIVIALGLAAHKGLSIPIVCNSSGYQKLETIAQLEGIIDIYMVDMRYNENEIARECSNAVNYREINRNAIKEMYRQVGNLEVDDSGLAKRGILIRHLVLPGGLSGSNEIFDFLANEISTDIYVSLMSQYFPAYQATEHDILKRRITATEFDKVVEMFYNAGLKNGFIQELR